MKKIFSLFLILFCTYSNNIHASVLRTNFDINIPTSLISKTIDHYLDNYNPQDTSNSNQILYITGKEVVKNITYQVKVNKRLEQTKSYISENNLVFEIPLLVEWRIDLDLGIGSTHKDGSGRLNLVASASLDFNDKFEPNLTLNSKLHFLDHQNLELLGIKFDLDQYINKFISKKTKEVELDVENNIKEKISKNKEEIREALLNNSNTILEGMFNANAIKKNVYWNINKIRLKGFRSLKEDYATASFTMEGEIKSHKNDIDITIDNAMPQNTFLEYNHQLDLAALKSEALIGLGIPENQAINRFHPFINGMLENALVSIDAGHITIKQPFSFTYKHKKVSGIANYTTNIALHRGDVIYFDKPRLSFSKIDYSASNVLSKEIDIILLQLKQKIDWKVKQNHSVNLHSRQSELFSFPFYLKPLTVNFRSIPLNLGFDLTGHIKSKDFQINLNGRNQPSVQYTQVSNFELTFTPRKNNVILNTSYPIKRPIGPSKLYKTPTLSIKDNSEINKITKS